MSCREDITRETPLGTRELAGTISLPYLTFPCINTWPPPRSCQKTLYLTCNTTIPPPHFAHKSPSHPNMLLNSPSKTQATGNVQQTSIGASTPKRLLSRGEGKITTHTSLLQHQQWAGKSDCSPTHIQKLLKRQHIESTLQLGATLSQIPGLS